MEVIRFVQSFHTPLFDSLAQAITMVGEDTFFIILALVIIWCINKKEGWHLGLIALSSGALNAGIKQIFKIQRPIGGEDIRSLRLETAGGYSFPSGHTQFTASIWTKLALMVKGHWFSILAAILIVLVGLSRIYLGVHYLSDVIAGLIIGILWALIFDKILTWMEERPESLLVLSALILASLPFFLNADYFKIAGTLVGLLLGGYLEKRYLHFQEKAPLLIQIIKVLSGLIGVLAIKSGLKAILPASLYSDALRYFLIGLFAMFIAPYFFGFLTKNSDQTTPL